MTVPLKSISLCLQICDVHEKDDYQIWGTEATIYSSPAKIQTTS